jgi:hypothetical protein
MNKTQIFPLILMILDVLAAFVYLYDGDFKKFIYWISAAVLTWSVTF